MRARFPAPAGLIRRLCPVTVLTLAAAPAYAASDLSPTAGNSVYICDSATDADGLVDLSGANSLTMPVGGTGIIDGDVTFGALVDTVTIHAGTINGDVAQGSGQDIFTMTGGAING